MHTISSRWRKPKNGSKKGRARAMKLLAARRGKKLQETPNVTATHEDIEVAGFEPEASSTRMNPEISSGPPMGSNCNIVENNNSHQVFIKEEPWNPDETIAVKFEEPSALCISQNERIYTTSEGTTEPESDISAYTDNSEMHFKIEIKEETQWLETPSTEISCKSEDYCHTDVDLESKNKVETNKSVTEETPHNYLEENYVCQEICTEVQPQLLPSAQSRKRRSRRYDMEKQEEEAIEKCLSVMARVEEKDDLSIFGQFVASELRNLKDAPELQIELKNLIKQSIIEVTSKFANKFSTALPVFYVKLNDGDSSAINVSESQTN